ncbi:MAG: translation initiation factor IF-2 subunit beta [Candidatus Micrarchaeota archaeon]|nr:translation initiation factor IF-2 subunit beta [Candidatus Micrarchaeota archaeon]
MAIDFNDYEKLLEKAYSELPEKRVTKERLEIPLPEIHVQGNRTMVKNFEAIINKMRRDPKHVGKFLAKELATSFSLEGGKLILNTKVNEKLLNEKLKQYTETFLYCKQCKLPDTRLEEIERGLMVMICEACGARSSVPKV